jgi:hypothetical protein
VSDDAEEKKQDDDRDRDPEQPKQNASPHRDLLADDQTIGLFAGGLFLAGNLANGILHVTDGTLRPTFGLIGFSFGLGLGIAQSFAGLFLDFAGRFFHASCNTILVHGKIPLFWSVTEETR